jgi:competence protein ComGC
MSKLEDLIAEIQKDKASKEEVKAQQKTTVVSTEPTVKAKSSFPWLNVVLVSTIVIMGYLLFINRVQNSDPIDNKNVAELVEKYENLYSTYKGQTYTKLAELIKDGKINNQEQLKKNAQAILEEARDQSLGKIDQIDQETIPEVFPDDRSALIKYFQEKSIGYEKAGK